MATGVPSKDRDKRKKIPIAITYEGKKSEDEIIADKYADFTKMVEINGNSENLLFFGDNKDALLYLINNGYRGKIKLVYIDPPFATSSNFINRQLEHAYSDSLCGGAFVEFLRERIILIRELLTDNGSIYLHLDSNMAFIMKIVMDEIFGAEHCRAFITRKKCSTKNYTKNTYGNVSDYIMFYSKGNEYTWNRPYDPWEEERMKEEYPYIDTNTGKRYKKVPIHAPGTRNGSTGQEWRGKLPPLGKHWQFTPDKLDEFDAAGEIYWSPNGNPRRMVFCDPNKGVPKQDIWLNYRDSINQAQKTTGYPTEKNYEMLKMIVCASSNPNDIVMDCFAGSGTTLGAAYECGRKWIGVDNSPESMRCIIKRLSGGLESYGDYVNQPPQQVQIEIELTEKCPFSIYTTKELESEFWQKCHTRETSDAEREDS